MSDDAGAKPRKETMIVFFQNQEKEEHWEVHICAKDNKCVWCEKELLKGAECFRVRDGLMHIECMKFKQSLRPSWWMAEKLGITKNQFERLVKKSSFASRDYYVNHFKCVVPLWDPALVKRMKDTIGVIDARARLARRKK